MLLSAEQLKKEIQIAPVAIPLSEQEILLAGFQLSDIPEAQAVDETTEVNICLPENNPKIENTRSALEKILPRKKDEDYAQKVETFVVERVAPAQIISSLTPNSSKRSKLQYRRRYLLGAWLTLVLTLSILFTLVSAAVLYFDRYSKLHLSALALTCLFIPLYLIFVSRVRCNICHQRLFYKEKTAKKRSAHYFPLIGYVIPTCLHIVFKGWFRCMHCGAETSLSKAKGRERKN
jgi:DNA-directed RNA polymerase subunit RPC12/RpoP